MSRTFGGNTVDAFCAPISCLADTVKSLRWLARTANGSGTSPNRRPAYQYAAFTNGLASCGVTA
ncbi:hypothetical protein MPC38_04945 [Prescottella equi]|nr:hypothetical protein [Prescottella equi]UNQ40609.1 hypothetical protein MPC38_04945 [Prescottella equi]